jgi:hypothetical protein
MAKSEMPTRTDLRLALVARLIVARRRNEQLLADV